MRSFRRELTLAAVLLTLVGLAGGAAWPDAAKVETVSKVESATVFTDASLTTRVAEAELPAGYTVVSITKLPYWMSLGNTVVRGKGKFTLLSTEIVTRYEKTAPNPEVEQLIKQKEAIEAKMRESEVALNVLAREESYFRAIAPGVPQSGENGSVPGDITAEQAQSLLEVVEKGLLDVFNRRLAESRKAKELKKEFDALSNRIKQFGASSVNFKEARVTVKAEAATKAAFELVALGGSASWVSAYDARLINGERVNFSYYADVWQSTGEEWKDIALKLSTSSIASVVLPPEVKRLVIEYMERIESKGAPAGDAAAPQKGFSTGRPDQTIGMLGIGAESRAVAGGGGMIVEFEMPTRATVPGDGTRRRLLVKNMELAGAMEYDTAPRVSPSVFARIETTNDTEYPFIPGMLRAFSGGEFLGTSAFGPVASGGKFKLYFGEDSRIKVKYRHLSAKEDTSWGSKVIEFEWVLEVKNEREMNVVVNLNDALPKSGNAEVKIKSVDYEPKPMNDPEKEDLGIAKWKLGLGPGQKVEVKVSFTVSFPKDAQLQWTGPWMQGGAK